MKPATAATAALAMGAMAAAVTIAPAMAAARPAAAHPAAHAKSAPAAQAKAVAARARVIAQQAQSASSQPVVIGSEEDNYKYVTVVTCQGADTPPPITLGKPGTPLTASGIGPSAGILKSLQQPNPYKTIYTCTVVVKVKVPPKPKPTPKSTKATKATKPKKAPKTACQFGTGSGGMGKGGTGGSKSCTKPVTVNTGFGGLAPQVTMHHPQG
ncbi:MAG TPA: hypothetical protein VN714_34305 [Trebonia sp.]|jgi:hypothetical protein|nr:hypothetical protein [Trebonia sp.]